MSTLSRMSGGLQYMGHTSRDWKQKFAREESEDDVKKLLDFFKKMQKINPEFFYDYDIDADNRAALKTILPHTLHKLCRWHIMKKYKDHLALLYKAHEKLKVELNAVLNHPLMPSEFERAWKNLIQRYNLQDDEVMNSLWDDRHEWISAYYKEIFCARMTSTQRSESMNRILKKIFVKEKHDLHLFAQQVDKCIQTRKAVEHAETVANESEVKTTTKFGFEVQLSKVYTRAVFADFKETLHCSTAFRAERCPENPTKYLVHHYNRSDAFDWARHNFHVVADEKKGVYELLKIPEVYIMKRYTRNARSDATFDRRDYEQTTPDGTSLFCRRKLLTETAMDLANRATRSNAGCHRALSGMRALIEEVDVLNEEEEEEEEEEAAKLKQAEKSQHDKNAEQVENTEHSRTSAIKKQTILPPPV
ncbi:protein FAR1-RELATED SEQUENCE 5-like [Aegilops tauschii subsp. strangulata]|uniref:protein FAR1-RELATED SEQUENCE 5-like n=1 Tax=Aegilops tauschii subsp. strangulata TaxID=200361 RepID=UPI00098A72C1|nr:protein FAR1-RELATED SEQUENCE 5-like [Aegilops tauschii subsp. strangulata]